MNRNEKCKKAIEEFGETLTADGEIIGILVNSSYNFENIDEFNFNFVKNKMIDECVYIFCRHKRIRRTKEKRLFSQLNHFDLNISELIDRSFKEKILNTVKIRELVGYVEDLLGGKRSEEWKLSSKLDL